jgi:cytochrome oxidase Cu insertion factor (SCO1/SenC/PrrC family)
LTKLCRRAPVSNETEYGAKMRIAVAIVFFVGLFTLSSGQENPPANHAVPPSVGLEIGHSAPAFALPDQFGGEQSNKTLKGSKGTVLLFFRSADW